MESPGQVWKGATSDRQCLAWAGRAQGQEHLRSPVKVRSGIYLSLVQFHYCSGSSCHNSKKSPLVDWALSHAKGPPMESNELQNTGQKEEHLQEKET